MSDPDAPVVEKRCIPISDSDHDDPNAICEVARDSWPKLVASETYVHETEDDRVLYRGPVDLRQYDAEDVARMRRSDTVTIVEE